MTARSLPFTELPSWPRYLSQAQAAAYLGVSPDTFTREVKAGIWPVARDRGGRRTWDRALLDRYADTDAGLRRVRAAAVEEPTESPEDLEAEIRRRLSGKTPKSNQGRPRNPG